MQKYFITAIGTDSGKTFVSAIFVEALKANYWKPVQCGEPRDTDAVKNLISNNESYFFDEAYFLKKPASPHDAAKEENIEIKIDQIKKVNASLSLPKTEKPLIIEGAGGLLVPLNNSDTILDLIQPDYKIIVVSRHYLGSINHTLLTVNLLAAKGFDVSIIFSGNEHPTTESIIKKMTNVNVIGRIDEEPYFDKNVIKEYANKFREKL